MSTDRRGLNVTLNVPYVTLTTTFVTTTCNMGSRFFEFNWFFSNRTIIFNSSRDRTLQHSGDLFSYHILNIIKNGTRKVFVYSRIIGIRYYVVLNKI